MTLDVMDNNSINPRQKTSDRLEKFHGRICETVDIFGPTGAQLILFKITVISQSGSIRINVNKKLKGTISGSFVASN